MITQVLFFVGIFFISVHTFVLVKHTFFGNDDDVITIDPGHQLFILALFVGSFIAHTLGM